jgi:hypothetical protein
MVFLSLSKEFLNSTTIMGAGIDQLVYQWATGWTAGVRFLAREKKILADHSDWAV